MKQITASEFEAEVSKCDLPVLVDFYTDQCGPCRMMAPVLEELSAEESEHMKVVKINAAENMQLASAFGISAVPTFIVFHNGGPVGQKSGMQSKQGLLDWVNESATANQ
ncbi:MAG: thioredoxin 1 [Limisphaerales bacterium]|jgi:thioredoxin 1